MISIIICSINKILLEQLKLNIEHTIGVPFEIIAIDNKGTGNGICKVYNEGGKRATFSILCFLHEDTLFATNDWGRLVLEHFKDSSIGLLGIAGGDTKGIVPSSWSTSFKSNEVNLIQHDTTGNSASRHILITEEKQLTVTKKVVALDGVFLCTRKQIFNRFTFDETNLTGFHGYDIDYSLQLFGRYGIIVAFDILIHHFSEGKPDKDWVNSAVIVSKKWNKKLPFSVHALSVAEYNFYHWMALQIFLEKLLRLQYNYTTILSYYLRFSFTRYFKVRRFLSMGKYVLLSMYKKTYKNKQSITAHGVEETVFR